MPLGRQRTAPTLAYSPGNFASPGEVFLLLPSGKLFRAKKWLTKGKPVSARKTTTGPLDSCRPRVSPVSVGKYKNRKKTLRRVVPCRPCVRRKRQKPKKPLAPCCPVSPLCPSEKTKTGINPLRRMQNVSCEPWTLYPSENPSSKLGYFQAATSSPYRVLHPAQGDKQKTNLVLRDKNPFFRDKNHHLFVNMSAKRKSCQVKPIILQSKTNYYPSI